MKKLLNKINKNIYSRNVEWNRKFNFIYLPFNKNTKKIFAFLELM